jgi:predicted adenine nucleotide alpha hydrolase (AANH) superfamily ATPase
MKVAIHICCGPCAVYTMECLIREGHHVTGFWYNPNIHPYVEYIKRLDSLKRLAESENYDMVYDETYDLDGFLKMVASNPTEPHRCRKCYGLRLNRTAEFAAENGMDFFTTTLTVSPHQDHEIIREIGTEAGRKYGVEYRYCDFRDGYRQGHEKARAMGQYMQQYCGCVYSERDRFIDMKPEKILRRFS